MSTSYTPVGCGESVIDVGVFEPRPLGFLEAGRSFRGWSGSGKKAITISRSDATPGYIPRSIKPGTWKIALGLYRVSQAGCTYSVVVRKKARVAGRKRKGCRAASPPPRSL